MSDEVKRPKLKRDWKGRYVRLRRTLENHAGDIFDEGTIMYVVENYGGLELNQIHTCPVCERRRRRYIKKVDESAVDLLPESYKPEGSQ